MSAARESRPEGNQAADVLDKNSNSNQSPTLYGASVETQLDGLLTRLMLGTVELYQCTPALAAWWTFAHENGRKSRQAEIDRLSDEADRLHLVAYNSPKDAAAIVQRRLDGHFEAEAERFFGGVE